MVWKTYFRNHILLFILTTFLIIVSVASYYRFMIRHDYVVGYEGVCDPKIEQCFIGCEDDACTEEYYYSQVIKYAPDLYNECGSDITDCEAASMCFPNDQKCSVNYCNPEIDGDVCTVITLDGELNTQDNDSIKDDILQDDNISDTNI